MQLNSLVDFHTGIRRSGAPKGGPAGVAVTLDGVDPDFVGDATADGYTALLAACNYGHVEVARLLWTTAPT